MIFLLIGFLFPVRCSASRGIEVYNRCPFPVWPAIQGPGNPGGGGFRLENEQSRKLFVDDDWKGVIWARTWCDDRMNCATGSCGNRVECNGAVGRFPFSAAEFSLNEANDEDVYAVSLINGYNVPILIEPFGGQDCRRAGGCVSDINAFCPEAMRVRMRRTGGNTRNTPPREQRRAPRAVPSANTTVGCRSACDTFRTDRECCRGAFSTPDTCFRSHVAQSFKDACPTAYSYLFDDPTSSFGCQNTAEYLVQFC